MTTNILVGSGLQVNDIATFNSGISSNGSINVNINSNTIIITGAQIDFSNNVSNFNIGNINNDFIIYNKILTSNALEINYTNNIVSVTSLQINVTGYNPQGLSIVGVYPESGVTASNDATQIFFQSNSSGTITTHWQLGPNYSTNAPEDFWLFNNIGNYNVIQIHAKSSLINVLSDVIVTGSIFATGSLTVDNGISINATSSTFCINIVGIAATTGVTGTLSGTQIGFSDNTYTVWQLGPNFSGGRENGVGLYDFLLYNTHLGYNQIAIQYENALVDINSTLNVNQSINVTNTLTANDIVATSATIDTTLTAQQVICKPNNQGAGLHIYGDPNYSAELAFLDNSGNKIWEVGGTTTNITGSGNFFFIYSNQLSTYAFQIVTGEPMETNINGTINAQSIVLTETLTATTIVPTSNDTGSLGTSNLNFYESYIEHAYLGYIDTLVYMSVGASFYGKLIFLNTARDNIFTFTINSSNQLNISSLDEISPITIDAGTNNVNLPGELNIMVQSGSDYGLNIYGTTYTYAGTQIQFYQLPNTLAQWFIGPNYAGNNNSDFEFYNSKNQINMIELHYLTNEITFNSPLNITTTLTVSDVVVYDTLTVNNISATSATIIDTLTVNNISATSATIIDTLTVNNIIATSVTLTYLYGLPILTYSATLGDDGGTGTIIVSYIPVGNINHLYIPSFTWTSGTYSKVTITNPLGFYAYDVYYLTAVQIQTSSTYQLTNISSSGNLTTIYYDNIPSGTTLTINPMMITYFVSPSPA